MSNFVHHNAFEAFYQKVLCKLQYYHMKRFGDPHEYKRPVGTPQEASDRILKLLDDNKPCMIARYGGSELYCLANYIGIKNGPRIIPFIKGDAQPWWWISERIRVMQDQSGFFPLTEEAIVRFCELLLADTHYIDLLASWLHDEWVMEKDLDGTPMIFLPYLEPYYAEKPWTKALEGKRVVVVNFLADLMEFQYQHNRKVLFKNPDILPEFELRGVKSVLTYTGDNGGFESWFDALKWMEDEIDKEDYDICIIGCGAYGLHLAAHVKRMGKKAIHLGGATQLLFGIKGNRWEDPMYGVREWGIPKGFYTDMFNEYWAKAGKDRRPIHAENIEGACYW